MYFHMKYQCHQHDRVRRSFVGDADAYDTTTDSCEQNSRRLLSYWVDLQPVYVVLSLLLLFLRINCYVCTLSMLNLVEYKFKVSHCCHVSDFVLTNHSRCVAMFTAYFHTKLHFSSSSVLLFCASKPNGKESFHSVAICYFALYRKKLQQRSLFFSFFFLWLWDYRHCGHSWPIVPASGDNEDDCGEHDGM
jgi:hypothetical protein